MGVFFTSDTHFGDARRMRVDRRPFPSIAEHDRALVDNWNAVVGDDDEVWHLGDFAVGLGPDRIAAFLSGLNGRKHLVSGNNDGPATLSQAEWASVQAYAEIMVEGTALVLCHYAFRTWNGIGRGSINLHGHSHGRLKPETRQYDVGVDARNFRPVTLGEVTARLRSRRTRSGDAGS